MRPRRSVPSVNYNETAHWPESSPPPECTADGSIVTTADGSSFLVASITTTHTHTDTDTDPTSPSASAADALSSSDNGSDAAYAAADDVDEEEDDDDGEDDGDDEEEDDDDNKESSGLGLQNRGPNEPTTSKRSAAANFGNMTGSSFSPHRESMVLVTPQVWERLEEVRLIKPWIKRTDEEKEAAGTQLLDVLRIILRPIIGKLTDGHRPRNAQSGYMVDGTKYLLHFSKYGRKREQLLNNLFDALAKSEHLPSSIRDELTRKRMVETIVGMGGEFKHAYSLAEIIARGHSGLRNMETLLENLEAKACAMTLGADIVRTLQQCREKGWAEEEIDKIKDDPNKHFMFLKDKTVPFLAPVLNRVLPSWMPLDENDIQADTNRWALNHTEFMQDGSSFVGSVARWALSQPVDFFAAEQLPEPPAFPDNTHPLRRFRYQLRLPDAASSSIESPQFRVFRLVAQVDALVDAYSRSVGTLPGPRPDPSSVFAKGATPPSHLDQALSGSIQPSGDGSAVDYAFGLAKQISDEVKPILDGIKTPNILAALRKSLRDTDPLDWEANNSKKAQIYRESLISRQDDKDVLGPQTHAPFVRNAPAATFSALAERGHYCQISHPDLLDWQEIQSKKVQEVVVLYRRLHDEYENTTRSKSPELGTQRAQKAKTLSKGSFDPAADLAAVVADIRNALDRAKPNQAEAISVTVTDSFIDPTIAETLTGKLSPLQGIGNISRIKLLLRQYEGRAFSSNTMHDLLSLVFDTCLLAVLGPYPGAAALYMVSAWKTLWAKDEVVEAADTEALELARQVWSQIYRDLQGIDATFTMYAVNLNWRSRFTKQGLIAAFPEVGDRTSLSPHNVQLLMEAQQGLCPLGCGRGLLYTAKQKVDKGDENWYRYLGIKQDYQRGATDLFSMPKFPSHICLWAAFIGDAHPWVVGWLSAFKCKLVHRHERKSAGKNQFLLARPTIEDRAEDEGEGGDTLGPLQEAELEKLEERLNISAKAAGKRRMMEEDYDDDDEEGGEIRAGPSKRRK
ncbi:hypothetical protein OC846_003525 [Tilletia horrida]|uniref:Uncharacterized protein n=1 Tax=Tilletia horrida TaxID=155126 RepID=A0AAN6GPV0_9BASI|nr:hypothetical protein OC846_003525 [Tilletia horrida]KAK0565906.1 hypothetical protein OC861_003494 [Tilletia horrida]